MTKPKIKIHNIATDEVELREMNDAEYAEHLLAEAEHQKNVEKMQVKQAARQAAEAKLVTLGLDLEDLRALGL